MADMFINPMCVICKNNIKSDEGIFVASVGLEPYESHYFLKRNGKYKISFNRTKKTRGLMHRHCWNSICKEIELEKSVKPICLRNRLKSVQSEE